MNLQILTVSSTKFHIKKCIAPLLPTITNIVNLSLNVTGVFPDQFKSCSVHHLLKKPSFDSNDLSNYRPRAISRLSFLSII